MDSIYRLHPETFYYFHLKYTAAAYYRAMGNWDKDNWKKALQLYEELRRSIRSTNGLPTTDGLHWKQYTCIRYKEKQWPPAGCIRSYIPP